MDFNVKGINFRRENLSSIAIGDIKAAELSHGHLFLFVNDKPFLMLRAGEYVDQAFLQKYLARGVTSFDLLQVTSPADILKYENFFSQLQQARRKPEQQKTAEGIFLEFAKDFTQKSPTSFLNFLFACFHSFYRLDADLLARMQATSSVMFQRSLVSSAYAVLAALSNGFVDFKFVQDIYNLCFILDIGLTQHSEFNAAIVMACEAERLKPGIGHVTLDQLQRPTSENALFNNHPNLSYAKALAFTDKWHYPELTEVLRMHHEQADGSGFPRGICYSSISSWECLISFADAVTEFKERVFTAGDGMLSLAEAFGQIKRMEKFDHLPIFPVAFNLQKMLAWAKSVSVAEKKGAA